MHFGQEQGYILRKKNSLGLLMRVTEQDRFHLMTILIIMQQQHQLRSQPVGTRR